MLDRLEQLEIKVRQLMSLSLIQEALIKHNADRDELNAKGQANLRQSQRESKDAQIKADAEAAEARAKAIEPTNPHAAETIRAESKAQQDAWEEQKKGEDVAEERRKERLKALAQPPGPGSDPFTPVPGSAYDTTQQNRTDRPVMPATPTPLPSQTAGRSMDRPSDS